MEHQFKKIYTMCLTMALMLLLFISPGINVKSSFLIESPTPTGLISESISSGDQKNSTSLGMIQNKLPPPTKSQLSISPQPSAPSASERIKLAKTIQGPDNETKTNINATKINNNQINPMYTVNNQQKNNLKVQAAKSCLALGCEGSPPDLITGKCIANLVIINGICSSPSRIQENNKK